MNAAGLLTADYDYALPVDRIAQSPNLVRDESRLMVVDRASGLISHRVFRDLEELIPAGDALALNTTRVFKARLLGTRASGGEAEVLLLRPLAEPSVFEAMVHPGGKLKPGRTVHVAPGFSVEILSTTTRRTRIVRLHTTLPVGEAIDRQGHVPLPPYIDRPDAAADDARYQTVYANTRGSVATPTAGLHFTTGLLDALQARGVRRANVVLHVGAGTFKPVESADPAGHTMHEEWYRVPPDAADTLNAARASGGALWSVGTTCARTLESAVQPDGRFAAAEGETCLFIRPPYVWRAVDRLITNFHLPRSTLLMLVAAFAGYDLTMRAYRVAIDEGYRFYSYGDAMVIL